MRIAALGYNVLRWTGFPGLLGQHASHPHPAKRRRLRTVSRRSSAWQRSWPTAGANCHRVSAAIAPATTAFASFTSSSPEPQPNACSDAWTGIGEACRLTSLIQKPNYQRCISPGCEISDRGFALPPAIDHPIPEQSRASPIPGADRARAFRSNEALAKLNLHG